MGKIFQITMALCKEKEVLSFNGCFQVKFIFQFVNEIL